MNAKDIKIGNIYYVNFEPSRPGEFGKKHLGIVLKKNNNKITFVVVPMTSDSDGHNKVNLGVLECLPKNLQKKESYVVIDQIRTVNASRFMPLIEDGVIKDSHLDDERLMLVFEALFSDIAKDFPKKDELFSNLAFGKKKC